MESMLITLTGPDRPGVVELLSGWVAELEGSWKDANLHYVAGQFAGIIEVNLPVGRQAELANSLQGLRDYQYLIQPIEQSRAEVQHKTRLTVTGNDRSGIVKEISQAVNQAGGNILKLKTRCRPAPNWGGDLFRAQLLVGVEHTQQLDNIRANLESISNDLMVDFD